MHSLFIHYETFVLFLPCAITNNVTANFHVNFSLSLYLLWYNGKSQIAWTLDNYILFYHCPIFSQGFIVLFLPIGHNCSYLSWDSFGVYFDMSMNFVVLSCILVNNNGAVGHFLSSCHLVFSSFPASFLMIQIFILMVMRFICYIFSLYARFVYMCQGPVSA